MVTTVVNAAGEIERLTTGKAPERPEVVADNAARAAKQAAKEGKEPPKPDKQEANEPAKEEAKPHDDADDVEDQDGLTPRQKRELSEKMLRAIGKKHREKMEAEEFAAEQYNVRRLAEQRATELEEEISRLKAQQATEKPAEVKKPVREAYESDAAYQDALVEFRVKEQLAKERQEAIDKAQKERQAELAKLAQSRLEKAATLVPDFEEVTEAADLRIPGHIAAYMHESEMFAELGYHFAKHPDIMEKLAKLSPARALVEVGKIESTLKPFSESKAEKADGDKPSSSDGSTPSPDTSAAPAAASRQSRAPVIKPLSLSSAGQVEKAPGEMTYAEAKADWERRRKVDLGRRRRH